MAQEDKQNVDIDTQPLITNRSNNITFTQTEEISPIDDKDDPNGQSQAAEEFQILDKISSNNKNMAEKENKVSILLSEYKQRIDQNKSMLKSRSTQELNKTNQSTGYNR